MTLISCKECGREISDSAQSCPHCGASNSAKKSSPVYRAAQVIVIIFGLLVAGLIVYSQLNNDAADQIDQTTDEIEKLNK